MARSRSSVSKARSYKEMGEYWDTHELSEHWDETKPVEFDVDIKSETTYYPIENALSAELRSIAELRGISPETLLNLWVQEKLKEQVTAK